jgi:hypothetical protein
VYESRSFLALLSVPGVVAVVVLLGMSLGAQASWGAAGEVAHLARRAGAGASGESSERTQEAPPRAPSRAPLATFGAGAGEAREDEGEREGASPEGADPLVSNGLGSPSCQRGAAGELSSREAGHCQTSGFMAAAAPTGNYGLDVHIDTSVLGVTSSWIPSALQDLVVTPVWLALVWSVHALLVTLEWCFTIDLLPSAAAGALGAGLRRTEASFTQPWLPLVLAMASVLALYHGVVRRRVAQTVGEAAVMATMMMAALWVISDPTGTLGSLGEWANEAALGTLAVAAQGAPSHPERIFAGSLNNVFSASIEAPWCYLEFGDVRWCDERDRLDPQLRSAGLELAAAELAQIGCSERLDTSVPCVAAGSKPAKAIEHSAQMLHEAQSNGAIFLAFPPNGPARNSINDQDSLLRALCESSDATSCRGPAAGQAQFRTAGQTWSRLGGLLLIVMGLLGMLLLLGFLALRLLTAALFGLLYLLLAPAMVLAPAFGEGGRSLFRKWGMQLLGTVVAKLLFSFLLGVVMALLGMISSFTALGWWTQWLLMSALWWGAFLHRHEALAVASGAIGSDRLPRHSIGRRVGSALESRGRRKVDEWRSKSKKPAPEVDFPRSPSPRLGPADKPPSGDTRSGDSNDGRSPSRGRTWLHPTAELRGEAKGSEEHAQLERVGRAAEMADAEGEKRPTAELLMRSQRIENELGSEPEDPSPADEGRLRGPRSTPEARTATDRYGNEAVRRTPRDYGGLATLAGYSREEFERLDPRKRHEARLAIDRELERREDSPAVSRGAGVGLFGPGGNGQGDDDPGGTPPTQSRGVTQRTARTTESSVMNDAREVQAGRKRQLGLGRP